MEDKQGHPRVIVVPITHSAPQPPEKEIELPQSTKTRLGLDDERSLVVVNEANDFAWPGPDLYFRPGHGPESAAYGFLPPVVFRVMRDRFLARYQVHKLNLVTRSE